MVSCSENMKRMAVAGFLVATVSACAPNLLDPDSKSSSNDQLTLSGTKMVIEKPALAKVNIIDLVCQRLPDAERTALLRGGGNAQRCGEVPENPENFNMVLAAFDRAYGTESVRSSVPAAVRLQYLRADQEIFSLDMMDIAKQRLVLSRAVEAVSISDAPQIQPLKDKIDTANKTLAQMVTALGEINARATRGRQVVGLDDDSRMTVVSTDLERIHDHLAAIRVLLSQIQVDAVEMQARIAADKAGTQSKSRKQVADLVDAAATLSKVLDSTMFRLAGFQGGGREAQGRAHRTAIQESIIVAADRRCEVVKQVITEAKAESSFFSSALTSIAGVTGALVPEGAARYFAGTAGGISASAAAWDNAYFQGQTIDLIIHGINSARARYRNDVLLPKRVDSLGTYPLAEAIGHALQYNGQCSVPAALHAIGAELRKVPDVDALVQERALSSFRQRCLSKALEDDSGARDTKLEACVSSLGRAQAVLSGNGGKDK